MRRSTNRGLTVICVCFAGTLFADVARALCSEGADSKKPAVDAIVRRLAERERLVRSCECLLSYRSEPTPPKMIALIEEHCRETGESPDKYIYTKEEAARSTYVLHW